jgi:hypothetical protein
MTITLYLVSAEHSSTCLFYCDQSILNLILNGHSGIVGYSEPFAVGSIAYDKHGNIAIWDGTSWTAAGEE